jgi:bifunctional DNA-binding transcriptional regulator/antitoxin component of YhaV-PrlF toxin-antitoxin module
MSIARVQSRGQVTVPQEIREACGVVPGTDLFFTKTGPARFECQVLPPRHSVAEITARYAMDGPAPDLARVREEMGEAVTEARLSPVERS